MVITFAVEGGIVGVGVYATFLAARVLRSPESVGAWLPRVVAGWHRGMYEAEMRRYERHVRSRNDDDDDFEEWPLKPDELPTEQDIRQLPDVRGLMKVSNQLIDLRMQPDEVSVIGADETPEDLAVADDFDQS
jgi:hypothetical protein